MKKICDMINQSIINTCLIYPSSFHVLSQFLTFPIFENQFIHLLDKQNEKDSLLVKMNPCIIDHITEDEIEINTIFQNDSLDKLKQNFINHSLNQYAIDRKNINLIEKCVFFNSRRCLDFLLEENFPISRHRINYYEIGPMEYGALKGNKNIINFCLEKGQKIQSITLKLGLIGHQNELVEWMIEKVKKEKRFIKYIQDEFLGICDNIEFNESLFRKGEDVNSKNDYL